MFKFNLYETITQKIIASLEKGVIPWRQTWKSSGIPSNFKTGNKYKGVNLLLLAMENHSVPFYLTFKQAAELGGRIKKGAKSSLIIYWSLKTRENVDDITKKETYPVLQYYNVFNITQTEGIDYHSRYQQMEDFSPIPACEEILLRYKDGPPIEHIEQNAYYNITHDVINLPAPKSFKTEEDYYRVAFHECIHSTGHPSRLNRPLTIADSSLYSKEELIAEMGSSFLCGHARLDPGGLENSAAYIGFWLSQLKEDKKYIFSITGQAQRAVEHILGHSNSYQKQEAGQ
ncbi:MAG: DUF1738 domain-containing protein [Candidatus Omnitrophica bacterium]|nr:DUF1738 domain-containing protein [Candidatus Omnitrophota bacterium]